jgi:hypothetical protein
MNVTRTAFRGESTVSPKILARRTGEFHYLLADLAAHNMLSFSYIAFGLRLETRLPFTYAETSSE